MQILELPDSAEWVHGDNGAVDSLTTTLAGTATWYNTPLGSVARADSTGDLLVDIATNEILNESLASMPVLAIGWHRWDRDSGTSGVRKNPWAAWNNNGSRLGYGIAGAYSRGQQSVTDTWQCAYTSVAVMDVAPNTGLQFQVNDESSAANAAMAVYASTNRHFLGMQVLNLNTLGAIPTVIRRIFLIT